LPDLVLDYHRRKVPIDHPDLSVTRAKLEYPTVDVSFSYLAAIDKVVYSARGTSGLAVLARDAFADKAVFGAVQVNAYPSVIGRLSDRINLYESIYNPGASTADHVLQKLVGGTLTTLATEAIDIDKRGRGLMLSCSGSTLKSMRFEMPSPVDPFSLPAPNYTISVTDTTFASGYFGYRNLRETYSHGGTTPDCVYLKAPGSQLPQALMIMETEVEGSGTGEDPYRPSVSENLIDIDEVPNIPDFLKLEEKKYKVLKTKGFTDEEIQLLLGYIPQHQIDLDAITWGSFEFSEKSPTNIIVVTGDNPYKEGAIKRQIEFARKRGLRVFSPPSGYREAVELYDNLKREFEHWLAGKDNFAYQVLGWEVLDLFQNVDFYYGELIEHRTHYDQLKRVPDWEIYNRLNTLLDRLSKTTVLVDERDKHLNKLREILKKGW
jgi:hypothetical protein